MRTSKRVRGNNGPSGAAGRPGSRGSRGRTSARGASLGMRAERTGVRPSIHTPAESKGKDKEK